ncbi:snoRNA binding domain-containing protein [Besnoitia besnoiti]|uniref:SnoRNA binding domain-containing protein n=1 Tax=Besnoitia besnoiti TaxID=94643 RepID=A0A2A9M4I5_BESBE|nr:snoRNA binding domain-containing protein [Besnoitia besnoiti]PFH32859.1 snoRNA binding domain-containing protein [Besnoitia besnoiti]
MRTLSRLAAGYAFACVFVGAKRRRAFRGCVETSPARGETHGASSGFCDVLQSTLAESFLCDLQDLEEDEEGDELPPDLSAVPAPAAAQPGLVGLRDAGGGLLGAPADSLLDGARAASKPKKKLEDEDDLDTPIPDAVAEYEQKQQENYVGVVVSDLMLQPDFIALLERVRALTPQEAEYDNEELNLIEECNQRVIDVDRDILNIHRFIKDIYSIKFPELESIVQGPLEYIAVVLRIQNQTDLTQVDLSDLLPSSTIMALTVAASLSVSSSSSSSSSGRRLPAEEFCQAIAAAKEAIALAEKRKEILQYLESRMTLIAPNVSAILGAALAARLLTRVGGLKMLAKMPSQNIMLVGSQKKTSFALSGGKGSATGPFSALLCSSEILLLTPPAFRTRALRLLAGKVSLAARVDFFGESRDGEKGKTLREEIVRALIKAQEPPPAPQKKALPAPDERARPKRGGKKYRRMKEKYELTEVHKQLNRMQFGVEEDQNGLKAKGLGMLGKSIASGRLKIQAKQQKKLQPSRKRQQQMNRGGPARGGTETAGCGFSSSLTFTPIQGIELCNPDAAGAAALPKKQDANKKVNYFSSTGKFTKVEKDLASMVPKAV